MKWLPEKGKRYNAFVKCLFFGCIAININNTFVTIDSMISGLVVMFLTLSMWAMVEMDNTLEILDIKLKHIKDDIQGFCSM